LCFTREIFFYKNLLTLSHKKTQQKTQKTFIAGKLIQIREHHKGKTMGAFSENLELGLGTHLFVKV